MSISCLGISCRRVCTWRWYEPWPRSWTRTVHLQTTSQKRYPETSPQFVIVGEQQRRSNQRLLHISCTWTAEVNHEPEHDAHRSDCTIIHRKNNNKAINIYFRISEYLRHWVRQTTASPSGDEFISCGSCSNILVQAKIRQ